MHLISPGKLIVALLAAFLLVAAPSTAAKPKKGQARLAITEVTVAKDRVEAGEDFKVKGTIANRGKREFDGNRRIRVELRGGGEATVKVGSGEVPRIGAGKEKRFTVEATAPLDRAPSGGAAETGPYGVFACVKPVAGKKPRCKRGGGIRITGGSPPGPDFKPGARSLGDPYFPQIGNGGYDALHYEIALDYDPASNEFEQGTRTTMEAVATQDLSELSLDFQRDLAVSAVTVNGAAAQFAQVDATPQFSTTPGVTQPAKLVVTPPAGIPNGSEFEVEVSYAGTPVEITDADQSIEGWVRACHIPGDPTGASCDGSYTVNEPIGVQSWFPSNNYSTDKASFETRITIPDTHVGLGVGELENRTNNGDGTRTWIWEEDDPTAPYLTSATVGLFDYSSSSSFTEDLTGRNIPIYSAIDSAKNSTAKTTFATRMSEIPGIVNFFSERFGPYPFDSTGGVTDIAPDVGYALENQTKPHYATTLASNGVGFSPATQVHEQVHQWFGNSVSAGTWQEIWFNEGWAEWSAIAFNAGTLDEASLEAFFVDTYAAPAEDWSPPPADLGGPENLFSEFPVYVRPGAMLEGYRQIVGNDAFFAFARELMDEYGYSTITIDEFIAEAKEASGLTGDDLTLLDQYLDQWLRSATKPTVTPDSFAP